jgi:pimeloyl-ACP methyl ester carboxylesterase
VRRAALVLAVLLSGCGGGGAATTATHSAARRPAGLDGCLRPGPGVRFSTIGGTDAGIVGSGTTAIVLLNESDQNLCSWLPFAKTLAGAGYEALVFDAYAGVQVDVALQAARYLRAHGAKRVVLMGASVGARASLAAAARGHVDAAIALSAEQVTQNGPPDLNGILPHLRVPTLMVYTREDGYVGGMDIARDLYRHVAAKDKHLLVLPGDAHGTATLPKAQPAILAFLRSVSR